LSAPSDEQLSALKARLDAGHAPYADFWVFGPFGRLAAKMRKYEVKTMVGDRSITKLMPGPNIYEQWLGSWGVYKSAMIMLEAACPRALDAYEKGIKCLTIFFPGAWGDIVCADVDCRYDYWGRIKSDIVGSPVDYEPMRPWNFVILHCAYGKSTLLGSHWWEMNLVKPLQSSENTQAVIARMENRPSVTHRFPANTSEGVLQQLVAPVLAPPPRNTGASSTSQAGLCQAYNDMVFAKNLALM
jgi:hypothetical protein